MSISPCDRLEFVGDRVRFEKSSLRWRIIGGEEIEEMEEGRTEIENQSGDCKNFALFSRGDDGLENSIKLEKTMT